MINLITEPWPWYISGPLIGLTVPLLLIIGNKRLGISGSLKHLCAACIPNGKVEFFNYDWKSQAWNLFFVVGLLLGGFITNSMTNLNYEVLLNDATKADLIPFGIVDFRGLFPKELFDWTPKNIGMMTAGGFLVGFGARYANGCTSGHAIMGLSLLKLGSLIAVIGFFIGGLIMTHLLYPLFF
jgi:uncharacterized membrane protein YedE/YeeE